MIRVFPFLFILLWSSAFITTKPIIDNSDPFSALAFRFFFVALGFLTFSIYMKQSIVVKKKNIIESVLSGVLFHGIYLGGVFYSISIGMPTGIAALIVTLQPVLTNALSGPILGEEVSIKQWVGVLLGFFGAALVLGLDVGFKIPLLGLVATILALIAITTSTIWQKKLSNNLPLSVSNFYQAVGGCLFHIMIIIFFAEPYIDFTKTFIIAMSHQIFLVSFGAFTILMFLIKKNSASKTVSIFFLIPATILALIAITTSTIWQKKLSNNLPLSVSNFYQAIGGCLFHIMIIIFFAEPYIDFTKTFIIAMSHQIFLVSFGAFTILMFLIKKNSASKTVSIFFLIPATSAFMAWLFLNENLTNLDLFGFFITSIGVYIATRN